jgi:hypothetical protein
MSVTATNLTMGPGTLYHGLFGAVEPTDALVNSTPAASAWTDVGGTSDGVKLIIDQKYTELDVDQVVDVPGRRLTKRDLQLQTSMAEPTLNNLTLALNASTQATGSGFASLEPDFGTSATQPHYCALILDGYNGDSARRIIVRKALSTDKVETSYMKDKQTLLKVTFSAHYVSPTVAPFKVIDEVS